MVQRFRQPNSRCFYLHRRRLLRTWGSWRCGSCLTLMRIRAGQSGEAVLGGEQAGFDHRKSLAKVDYIASGRKTKRGEVTLHPFAHALLHGHEDFGETAQHAAVTIG